MIITGEDVLWKQPNERKSDLARITELARILRPDCPPVDVGRLAAINDIGRALFYCVDNAIVGCAHLAVYPALPNYMATLETVVTHPDYLRRGIARRLVVNLIDWARAKRIWRVALLTEPGNLPARALYVSLGFKEFDLIRGRLYL